MDGLKGCRLKPSFFNPCFHFISLNTVMLLILVSAGAPFYQLVQNCCMNFNRHQRNISPSLLFLLTRAAKSLNGFAPSDFTDLLTPNVLRWLFQNLAG